MKILILSILNFEQDNFTYFIYLFLSATNIVSVTAP